MLYKKCAGCGVIIPQTLPRCEACMKKASSRHMEYNKNRRDKDAAAFYVSKEWRRVREIILSVFDGIDIYAYYVQREIIPAECVHHIEELRENWDRRLDPTNLIPLSEKNHGAISALYKEGAEMKKRTQKMLLALIERHFREQGGILKVLGGMSR